MQLWLFTFLPCMVAGGTSLLVGTGSSSDFEIVNLSDPDAICMQPKDYPHQTAWSVAGTLAGKPLICGGFNPPDKIFVVGGNDGSLPVKTVYIYDFSTDEWTAQPPLKQVRSWAFCGSVTDSESGSVTEIVVAGGTFQTKPLATSEIFDLKTKSWRQGPSLPTPIFSGASVNHDQSFILVGGSDGVNARDELLTYDPELKEFVVLAAKLRKPRQDHVAIIVEDSPGLTC
eukprot:TCALIF_06193-PA protein Name:"Similar to kel-10 Kelch repeat-containing protein kel-10 (Caenorhabditis elegans)" AED:0.19 eAED:0.75 QI:33/0.5/0.33/1/1/1/3/0/228